MEQLDELEFQQELNRFWDARIVYTSLTFDNAYTPEGRNGNSYMVRFENGILHTIRFDWLFLMYEEVFRNEGIPRGWFKAQGGVPSEPARRLFNRNELRQPGASMFALLAAPEFENGIFGDSTGLFLENS